MKLKLQIILLVSFGLIFGPVFSAIALPNGGTVAQGSATITQGSNSVTINQTTGRAIINWNGFSIDAGELAHFNQPGVGSAILNRVTGGNPSALLGTLTSNGQVFLINPNGIIVGPGGVINAGGGFIGSTLDVPDSAFMNGGDLTFSGTSMEGVVNYGTIKSEHGDVALIGYSVENHGNIEAPNGSALLAAGHSVLLKAAGDNRIYIKSAIKGDPDQTGADNQGVINAASAELKAAGGNIYALAVNHEGVVNATGVAKQGGRIVLTSDGGDVRVNGTLTAKMDDGNGGEILVGGEYQGSDPENIANARNVLVTEDSLIDVSADSDTGNGGRAIIWGNDSTYYYGLIDGRAGDLGGNGAFAEVSGKLYLDYQGLADLRAPNGLFGHLLLDPTNVEIKDGVAQTNVSGPAGNKIGSNGTSPTVINASTINTQLGLGDLTIETNAAGAEPGNITVNSAINWSSNNTLNFDAHNSIIINASITGTGSTAILNLYDFNGPSRGTGDITQAAGTTLQANEINIATQGNATFNGVLNTPLFRVNSLGVGGSLTANNTSNTIAELSFASSNQMSGDVSIFDSAGGIGLRFSQLDTLGAVTLRTVGDFKITGGPTLKAAKNVIFEAKGGTFTGLNPFTITAPRTIVYANTFNQNGLVPTISQTGNANFSDDPIGSGNVFYKPAVASSSSSTTTTTDTTTTFGGTSSEPRSQDNETQTNLNQANVQIINLDFSGFENEGEQQQEEQPEIDLSNLEIICNPPDCGFNNNEVIDLGDPPVDTSHITVGGSTVQGLQTINYFGFNVPFGSEAMFDQAIDSGFNKWKEKNPGGTMAQFQNLLNSGDADAQSYVVGQLIESWSQLKGVPDSQLTPDQLEFKQSLEKFIRMKKQKLADAARQAHDEWASQPQSNLAGLMSQPFPDIVGIAAESLGVNDPSVEDTVGRVLMGAGVATAGVVGAGLAAGLAVSMAYSTAAAAAALAGAAGTGTVGVAAGAAVSAGPVGIVLAAAVIGVVGAIKAFDDQANRDAYNQLQEDASQPVDLANFSDQEMASYMAMMLLM